MKRSNFINLVSVSLILLFGITFMVLALSLPGISYAENLKVVELSMPKADLNLKIVTPDLEQKIARSGCCSWHGGVCDCVGGRIVCCDGTFSPSCTCHGNSSGELTNSEE